MITTKRQFALITGASSGIGEAYALELAKRQELSLILLARREDRLRCLKDRIDSIWKETKDNSAAVLEVRLVKCDLSSAQEREKALNEIDAFQVEVSLLINNAGFGSVGRFSKLDSARELSMIEVNCAALAHFCRHFLPQMEKRKNGTVINLSSAAAFQAMPYMATYAASKAFVLNFSLALNLEAARQGVLVMAHCPGPTESEFHLAAGLKEKSSHLPPSSPAKVVSEALAAAKTGQALIINGRSNRFAAFATRFLPRVCVARISELMLRKRLKAVGVYEK